MVEAHLHLHLHAHADVHDVCDVVRKCLLIDHMRLVVTRVRHARVCDPRS